MMGMPPVTKAEALRRKLSREWTDRDWDRWTEANGLAILRAVPPSGPARSAFLGYLSKIGQQEAAARVGKKVKSRPAR